MDKDWLINKIIEEAEQSFAIHGGTTPRDEKVRKNLSRFRNGVKNVEL